MCEYCGCQDIEAIKQLTSEHDQVVELIGAIRSADRRDDLAAMIALSVEMAAVLRPHTRVEEEGLFPALVEQFPSHIAGLETEHRRIESVLAQAEQGDAYRDATWRSRLTETLDLLREHILKEQDGVFPAALSSLTTQQWETLDAIRLKVSSC